MTYTMNQQITQTLTQGKVEGLNHIRERRLQSRGHRRRADNSERSSRQEVTRTRNTYPPDDRAPNTWSTPDRTERRHRRIRHYSQRPQHSRPGGAASGRRTSRHRNSKHHHDRLDVWRTQPLQQTKVLSTPHDNVLSWATTQTATVFHVLK